MTYRLVAISLIVVLFSIINSSIYKIGLVSFLLIIRSVNFAKSFRTFPIAVKHGLYFCLSYKISIIKYVPSWIKCPNFLTNSIFIDNDYLCDILSFSVYKGSFFFGVMTYNIIGDIEEHTDHISHNPNRKIKGRVFFKKGAGNHPTPII